MAQLEPVLTLTIPSVHDWTVLDCRVFHPSILGDADPGADDEWKGQAAVFAHPYAPLGGSFDDGVVEAVVRELLGAGYVVATFNFRGAGNSAGKTSWTARPERGDYTSVVGFLVHYVHGLTLDPDENDNGHEASQEDCARLLHGTRHDEIWSPVLLMGGYSYGAMVTAQLPPLATMLLHFTAPAAGTAAAEVRLRAEHASREQRRRGGRRERKRVSLGRRIGGEEGRGSEDGRARGRVEFLSWRRVRLGVEGRGVVRPRSAPGGMAGMEEGAGARRRGLGTRHVVIPRAAYVLISPLQGLVTQLATMSLFSLRRRQHYHQQQQQQQQQQHQHQHQHHAALASGSRLQRLEEAQEAEDKLTHNPTLALFGAKDGLVPANKVRAWLGRLQAQGAVRLEAQQISGAGHFWAERGVLGELRAGVGRFAEGVLER